MEAIEPITGREERRSTTGGDQTLGWLWNRSRLFLIVFAVSYATVMLILGGVTWSRLYGPSPYHRYQAAALLDGHLDIGDSLYKIEQNLVWHDGKIQHVWGLGVGLWLAPFEFVYRLFGQKGFPDRIAMGVAFALLAAYSGAAGVRLIRQFQSPALGIGFICLIVFNPTLFNLNGGRHLIYEDTVLYASLLSLGILTAVVRVACFGGRADFLICCILAALSGLIRPTHALYGLAGVLVCGLIHYCRRARIKTLLPGMGIFLAGLMFLAGTNWLRFGSPFEFGHRLTAAGGAMVYFTRFGNPSTNATFFEASKELFGALFFSTAHIQLSSAEDTLTGQMFRASSLENAVSFQSPHARWRDMYMPTYDVSVAALVLAGGFGVAWWFLKNGGRTGLGRNVWRQPGSALAGALLIWSAIGLLGLGCFYISFSILCARYLLDFAPAFAAAICLVWLGLSKHFPKASLALLALWLGWEILPERGGAPSHYLLTKDEIPQSLKMVSEKRLEEFSGCYSVEQPPIETGIAFNGEGWSPDDGTAAPVVVLAVDQPKFVELKIEPRQSFEAAPANDAYRARMGNTELALEGVWKEGETMTVRFAVPAEITRRQGNELLFLCFIERLAKEDRDSQRILHSVRWR